MDGFLKYAATLRRSAIARSDGTSDDDTITTVECVQRRLARICFNTSSPLVFGKFKSRRIRCGQGALSQASVASKYFVAACPSGNTTISASIPHRFSASRIKNTSVLLSSTIKIRGFTIASSNWEREVEIGSFSGFGFDPNAPIVKFHDALTDGQPNAGTRVLIAGVKTFE